MASQQKPTARITCGAWMVLGGMGCATGLAPNISRVFLEAKICADWRSFEEILGIPRLYSSDFNSFSSPFHGHNFNFPKTPSNFRKKQRGTAMALLRQKEFPELFGAIGSGSHGSGVGFLPWRSGKLAIPSGSLVELFRKVDFGWVVWQFFAHLFLWKCDHSIFWVHFGYEDFYDESISRSADSRIKLSKWTKNGEWQGVNSWMMPGVGNFWFEALNIQLFKLRRF